MRRYVGDGPVTVGYFSGTPSHQHDFAIVTGALCRLLDRDPDVRFRIGGFMDDIGELAGFGDRVERLPLHDWVNLQRLIAEVEVNIAPLQENMFTNCKSELKFFVAAVVGTWTVATPTSTFAAAMEDDRAGRLCDAYDWDVALDEAVGLARDTPRYAEVAEENAEAVRDRYGWNRFADPILEATLHHG